MASSILNGNDFFAKGSMQVTGDGSIVAESEFNANYSFAVASRGVFAMNGGNKSVRFVFSASPYKAMPLSNKQGDSSSKIFAYINGLKQAIILSDIDASYRTEVTVPDAEAVSVSDTHAVIRKSDGSFVSYGDNTYGQGNLDGIIGVDMAVGNDFTAILNTDGIVTIIGNDNNGELVVPERIATFDSQDQPIKIDAGDDFIVVLRKDASIDGWGNNESNQTEVPIQSDPIIDISCGNNFALALTLSGLTIAWGDDTHGQVSNIPLADHGAQYIKAGVNRAVVINMLGRTHSWGEQIVVSTDGDVSTDTHAILSIPGDKFIVTSGRNADIVSVGTLPQAILDISGTIGNLKILDIDNAEYENHPMLRQSDALNIIFGIQDENMGPDYDRAIAGDGTIMPIIVGKNGSNNVFTAIHGAVKGVALAKAFENKDVCFELSGTDYDPFSFSGHRPVAEGFVTNDIEQKYEAIVIFSPFGKAIKFRKISGSYANEMPYSVVDLNNVPYDQARIVMYVRGAQDFQLHYVEVTDEIDASLLPAEVLFRDMDTAILQTRAAQSMVDIVETMNSLKKGLIKTSDAIIGMGENHKNKIKGMEERISSLEG